MGKDLPRIAEIMLDMDNASGRLLASVQNGDGREIALAPLTSVSRWALPIKINTEVRSWLEKRLRDIGRGGAAARAIAKAIGIETPTELSVADIFDIAA